MPLRSFTGGSHERFLADLLADDLALRLSRLQWLHVIDYLAAGSHAAGWEEPCRIGARLHADFVFAGTVSKVGRHVRLTVRLIDVRTGILAWVDQFDRQIDKGPLAQQDDIADRIAKGLSRFFGTGIYAAGA
jgi:TolB-like protein